MVEQAANTLTRGDSNARSPMSAAANANSLVPIDSRPVFEVFGSESARQLAASPGESLLLCIDSTTARTIGDWDRIRALADRVITFTPANAGHREGDNFQSPFVQEPNDRVLVVLSSSVSFAMLGQVNESETAFHGGWTADRDSVESIARALLADGSEKVDNIPVAGADALLQWTPQVTRMMSMFTRLVSSQQTTESVGRDDLLSVLDILKAISSRRRSHDVLYIFVEQIARVIPVDRCSVVRVWGNDDHGQVVASHDDAGVRDLVIELAKYPELRRSMDLFEKVVIEDAQSDPLTAGCEGLKDTEIAGLLVVPIVLLDATVGSLFLRAARKNSAFSRREIGFCEIVAEAASNALERAHLLERLQKANDRLERLAVTDELTGLHNHRHFRDRFAEDFDRARRYRLPLSCIIFDIDNFKMINDKYGHLEGDEILREIAARTHRTTRRSDILARYGGEEFVIVMPQTGVEGAMAQAERVRASIEQGGYMGLPSDSVVTASFGVSELKHEEMLDGESLIRAADMALYEAKRSGKNCVVVAGSTEN